MLRADQLAKQVFQNAVSSLGEEQVNYIEVVD
jgi:hypothetical protein